MPKPGADLATRKARWRSFVEMAFQEVCLESQTVTTVEDTEVRPSGPAGSGVRTTYRVRITAIRPPSRGVLLVVEGIFAPDGLLRSSIACTASNASHPEERRRAPVLAGRERFETPLLIDFLQATLHEREIVLDRLGLGEKPPFVFDHACWRVPSAGSSGGGDAGGCRGV